MGSNVSKPRHLMTPAELAEEQAAELRKKRQAAEQIKKQQEAYAAYEKQLTKNMQKWEEGKIRFIDDVVSQQSSSDKSVIDELNSKQPDAKRIGLVTKGNINKNNVYLSINENGDLIYDVVKNGKYISIEIAKTAETLHDLSFYDVEERVYFSVNLLMGGNRFPQQRMSIRSEDGEYVRFLPESCVYNYGPRESSVYYKAFYVSSYDNIDELPSFEKKTAQFMRTYLFADTDLTHTKSEAIKREKHRIQVEQKLKKQKEKDQLKQKQAQAKQEKKNEESVNYFLADNKTTWFSKLIEKMKGRGK